MNTVFNCSGRTSWGMEWHMNYVTGITFTCSDGIIRWHTVLNENHEMSDVHIDPMYHFSKKQIKEMRLIMLAAYTKCFKVEKKVMDLARGCGRDLIAPLMPTVTNFYQFLDSGEYEVAIMLVIDYVRTKLGLEESKHDWLFRKPDEDSDEYDPGGPLYKDINEQLIDVASSMTPKGSDYGWLVDPRTRDWNPTPQINPVTGERYKEEEVC